MDHPLWQLCRTLHSSTFVDLSHAFDATTPRFAGHPPMQVRQIAELGADGYAAEVYTLAGQTGTHLDAPSHMSRGRAVDAIPCREMVAPLVAFDISAKAAENADYELSVADVLAWEESHGEVPAGAFAALASGWSQRWPDQAAMENADGDGAWHWPGWSLEALALLFEERGILACGHETLSTDSGAKTHAGDYRGEVYILARDAYQVELLANLQEVPPAGAIVFVTVPKIRAGTGFPARVFAVVPSPA